MSPLQLLTHCVRTRPLMLRPLVPHTPVRGEATRYGNSTTIQCDPACHCSLVDRHETWWMHQTCANSGQAEHRGCRDSQNDQRATVGALKNAMVEQCTVSSAPASIREAHGDRHVTAADGLAVGRFGSPRARLKALEESSSAVCLRPTDSATLSNAVDPRAVGVREFVRVI